MSEHARERREEAKTDARPARNSAGNVKHRTSARPSYKQRRRAQIAAAGKPVPVKDLLPYRSKIKIVFVACHGEADRWSKGVSADRFRTAEKAEDAALEYSADRGYTVWPRRCVNCSTDRHPVWHVFREKEGPC
jgi:hypothetical protein